MKGGPYRMSNKTMIVLVGPSGSGKTSIGEVLTENNIPRLVTTTTRQPRAGEINRVDYYFRDFSEVELDEFVEQTIYNGNRYGLTKKEVVSMLEQNDTVHVSLDQSGAQAVKENFPKETFVVFVQITEEQMIQRMKHRGDSPEEIKARVQFCRETNELEAPDFADILVENKDINEAALKIIEQVKKRNE